ncbi:hypothetical protein C6956_26040, partial [Escherichia coli]
MTARNRHWPHAYAGSAYPAEARSLTEVAALCGFNDVGYFRQIFRKHTGLTPA